jgi:hypothetical protein
MGKSMKRIEYKLHGFSDLKAQVIRPLLGYSVCLPPNDRPTSVTLFYEGGNQISIHSETEDVAERREVGVLHFEKLPSTSPIENISESPGDFSTLVTASKLVIEESGTEVESGICLRGANGSEITIVAAAFPYHLALLGLGTGEHIFEPEYSLSSYAREDI